MKVELFLSCVDDESLPSGCVDDVEFFLFLVSI